MNKDIAPIATSAAEESPPQAEPAWEGILVITPQMVSDILEANAIADATEE